MTRAALRLSRKQILAFRRRVGGLDGRATHGRRSLRRAAWAGLQDSMPRAAVLSLHARVDGIEASAWDDPAFVQVWGPRYSVYVVPKQDGGLFTVGRLPDDERGRDRAFGLARKLAEFLDGGSMQLGAAKRALKPSSDLRYATTTGTVLIRWDGARQPTIRSVPPPDVSPGDAQRELARRYLHVFGPSTAESFARWAGIRGPSADATFARLRRSLTNVTTPMGEAVILNRDIDSVRQAPAGGDGVRLLPSGDAYYLLQGEERELLLPKAERRDQLWTSRVWPGAILSGEEIVGTWRRSKTTITANTWTRPPVKLRTAVEIEAASLPLPDDGVVTVDWGP